MISYVRSSERGKMKPTKCSFNSSFNIWFVVFFFSCHMRPTIFFAGASFHSHFLFMLFSSVGSRYFRECSIRSMIVVLLSQRQRDRDRNCRNPSPTNSYDIQNSMYFIGPAVNVSNSFRMCMQQNILLVNGSEHAMIIIGRCGNWRLNMT